MNEPNPKRLREASASYKRAIIFGSGSGLVPGGRWEHSTASVRWLLLRQAHPGYTLRHSPWIAAHARFVAFALSALALLLLTWVVRSFYHRGRRQAVLAERERLELDLHDTLAQSLAGIGFQLQAIRRAIPPDLRHLERQVDLARELLVHSRKEALRTFSTCAPKSNQPYDLLQTLEMSAQSMAKGGTLAIAASVAGEQRRLRPASATALLRIGQEAIANAIRHANPTQLKIGLFYNEREVTLLVVDNGSGFVDSGDLLGFGLRGMRKRAAAVSATFELSSMPGEGTKVSVVVPSHPAFNFSRVRNTLRHHLWEPMIHAHSEK